jgi:HD superfamily phosphohydrolase YqeK
MSGAASTDAGAESLPAVVRAAAGGELPAWANATPRRREHMGRVAALLSSWAEALSLPEAERVRWAAAGWLHDALRDASEAELRAILPADYAEMHPNLLHGPAAAHRLAGELDPALLEAIRYHTLGHPSLDRLGRALYLADFLEPGRDFAVEWRAALAERMPGEMDEVLAEVLGARIQHLVSDRKPIRPETAAFWSAVVGQR